MVTINRFFKTIICLLMICFFCVCIGSIEKINLLQVGTIENHNQSLLIGFAVCLICFMLAWKVFRWLDTLDEKVCFRISLGILVLIMGIFLIVSFSARVTQFADSTDVMDTAFYLRDHVEATEELPYIQYVESFGNNYSFILFESFLIKILACLGVHDIGIVLTHLNIIVLMAAIVLTWLIVKETRGIRAAAKTAVLCLLNPYLYLIVNWTYSMTYSLPIMMGILFIALRLKKAKTTGGGVALAVTEGLLIGGGFLIRPTTVFPLIAAGIVWLPSLLKNIRKKINRKRIVQVFCILFAAVLIIALVNIQVDRRFARIKTRNLPLSFWTLLGSHDDGIWNGADFSAVRDIRDPEEIAKYTLDKTVSNYRQQGIAGTLNLWYRKLLVLWADGGFFYRAPVVSEGNVLSDYFLGSGARNQLTQVYSQAFRLFMIVGFLLACGMALARRNMPEIVLVMMITVFGSIAFHMIWETNPRYDIPFILPALIIVGYGMSSAQIYLNGKKALRTTQKRTLRIAIIGFLIIACSSLNTALKEETTLNFYRVFSSANTRVSAVVEPEDCEELEQDFYTSKPFNTLFLKASLPPQKSREDCSSYELNVLNDDGQILSRTQLLPEQLGGSGFKVSFDTTSGYKHYHIKLEKTEPKKESILFYTQYTYGVDPYKGILTTDGGNVYPSDLMMDVYEVQQTAIYSPEIRIIVIALIILAGSFVFFPRPKRKEL